MTTEQFHHVHGDTHITLPYLRNIKVGVIRKLRGANSADQFFGIIEAVADEDALAAIDEMTADEFGSMMETWQEASGITVGESVASPKS